MALGVPQGRNFWWGAIVGLLAIGGLMAVLFATGILQLRGNAPQAAITQQGSAPPPITAKGPKQMPDDVRAWLEHLERIEKKRVALAQKQVSAALVQVQIAGIAGLSDLSKALQEEESEIQTAPTLDRAQMSVAEVRKLWSELAEEYSKHQPPSGCQEISVNYDQTLRETGAHAGDIFELTSTAESNPQVIDQLLEIFSSHRNSIDEPATRTDKGVQAICDAYDTRKWFTITRDPGGAMPGLTMPNIGGLTP